MFKITDTRKLGTIYKISDSSGEMLGSIQVIYDTEILEAAIGEYNDTHSDYNEYLTHSIEHFTGCEDNELYRTLWWPSLEPGDTLDMDSHLAQAFEHAIKYGYDTVILEDSESVPTV